MIKNFILLCFILLVGVNTQWGQKLQAGFDKNEYKELMYISARTSALDTNYEKDFPPPARFQRVYRSAPIGLDNLWELWTDHKSTGVISLRGTTEKQESWLANFYAAMVPAKGKIQIGTNDTFTYTLADHPQAAVHVGWLLATAILSKEVLPQLQSQYQQGIHQFLIIGHSQGGAIAFLMNAYLQHLQKEGKLPQDLVFKTYCSAAPKPGNLYFAYEYEAMTQMGWAFNVVNAADWVPEVPMSIQTLNDFNPVNPFANFKDVIKKQKFPQNLVLKSVFNKLDKPTRKAQKNYEKYLGDMASKFIKKSIKGFEPPEYFHSNNYVRAGQTIVLLPDAAYYKKYPNDKTKIFRHHLHGPYLYLLDQQFKD